MTTGTTGSSSKQSPLTAFVSFPSPYTQSLIISALVATLPNLSLSLAQFPEDSPPALQWADYDLLSLDIPHKSPETHLISSLIYRKALIRKHQLHNTISEYLAKSRHRGVESVLADGGIPQGWVLNLQFADELDEALMDDAWELREALERNLEVEENERSWFILKPGFADRAQGIRMFSTEDELRAIFESFEPSSDEEEDDDDEDDVEEESDGVISSKIETVDTLSAKVAELGHEDATSEDDRIDRDIEEDEDGTGVMTSQLRFFIIQEYMPRPILFDILADPVSQAPPEGFKFHLRAYVLVTGTYTVHLSRTMLALFSGSPYTLPRSSSATDDEIDLRPHLTNTCLQTDAFGAPTPPEELVKLFWELEGLRALSYQPSISDNPYRAEGQVSREWLEGTFDKVGQVIGESVKAGAECGSFGLQFMPNAFEIFGVDLLLSFPDNSSKEEGQSKVLPIPVVTLLEYNASPDFHQSGQRLRKELLEMFKGVVRISVAPFFNLPLEADNDEYLDKPFAEKHSYESTSTLTGEEGWTVGDEKWGWRIVGKGEIRGSNWG